MQTVLEIIQTPAVVSFFVLLVWFGVHKLAQAKQWSDERWYGIVHAALQEMQAMNISFGPAWLKAAEAAFEAHYVATHGESPSVSDLRDGVLDMARTVGPQVVTAIGDAVKGKAA